MIDFSATIDRFKHAAFDIDCSKMVLEQTKAGGARFEGQGFIRQSADGILNFKIYVSKYDNVNLADHFHEMLLRSMGKLYTSDMFYELTALGCDGTRWTAKRVLPQPRLNAANDSALIIGKLDSVKACVDAHAPAVPSHHFLRLHFFEEYDVPL